MYVDGNLALDVGGAHGKVTGQIDFSGSDKKKKAIVSKTKVSQGSLIEASNTESNFEIKGSNSDEHTLTMFYMERGMWNSNMSISYSFVPLPSGLTLSKTLDTKNVNAGLKNAVQGLDDFNFEILTKNLRTSEENYSNVDNLGYTLYDYNNHTDSEQVAENSTATFSSSYFASEFINTKDNSSAFYAGTGFQITESIPEGTKLQYDTSKTKWGVYDSVTSRAAIQRGTGAIATFDMGSANSSDMDVVNRYVNFVNTPKVGSLSVEKKYEGNAAGKALVAAGPQL